MDRIDGNVCVKTEYGILKGALCRSGVRVFRGVPFAKPPVGELRWKPPVECDPWDGIREAVNNPPAAVFDSMTVKLEGVCDEYPASEDCLYMNIWVPAADKKPVSGDKWPVMLWFPGSTTNISQKRFNPENLAAHGLIVVTSQHRLGVFASFALKELSQEEGNNGSSGNLDVLDHVAALRWINRNIEVFGGDKNNVTISGHSLGGSHCERLQISPLAKGLFHKIFAMCGSVVIQNYKHNSVSYMERSGAEWMKKFGTVDGTEKAENLSDMRKKSTEELLKIPAGDFQVDWRGYGGGEDYSMPKRPQDAFADGDGADVPIFMGWANEDFVPKIDTLEEYRAKLVSDFGDDADMVFGWYPAYNDNDAKYQAAHAATYSGPGAGMTYWARLHMMKNKSPVYTFIFHRRNSTGFAKHGYQNSYWFGNFDGAFPDMTFPFNTPGDYVLAERMMECLVQFCRTGDPNTELVKVPVYDEDDPKAVGFDVGGIAIMPISPGVRYFTDKRIENILRDLKDKV